MSPLNKRRTHLKLALSLSKGSIVHPPSAMLAFLKRRWILLSCACVLLACTSFDLAHFNKDDGYREIGLRDGRLFYWKIPDEPGAPIVIGDDGYSSNVHSPTMGKLPLIEINPYFGIWIPVWVPLSAILGWIVIRELRWREKRAKAAQATP